MSVRIANPSTQNLSAIVKQLEGVKGSEELRSGPNKKTEIKELYVKTSWSSWKPSKADLKVRELSQQTARNDIIKALCNEFPVSVQNTVMTKMSSFFAGTGEVTVADARAVYKQATEEASNSAAVVPRRGQHMAAAALFNAAELRNQNLYTDNASPKLRDCMNQFSVFGDLKDLSTPNLANLARGLNESIKILSANSVSGSGSEADFQSAKEAKPIYTEALDKVYEIAISRVKDEAIAKFDEFKETFRGENKRLEYSAENFLNLGKSSNPCLALEMGLIKIDMADGFNFMSDLHGVNSLTLGEGRAVFEKHLLTNDANVLKAVVNQVVKDLGGTMRTNMVNFNAVNTVIWNPAHAVPDDKPVRSLFDAALTECSMNFKSEQSNISNRGAFLGPFFN
jgi:hypothetical protein